MFILIYIDVTIGDCRTLTQRMLLVTTLRSQIITWLQSSARHTAITRLLAADIVAQFPLVTPCCAQAAGRAQVATTLQQLTRVARC